MQTLSRTQRRACRRVPGGGTAKPAASTMFNLLFGHFSGSVQ